MNHLREDELILYYYGEAVGDSNVEAHLASCSSCRAQYQDLQRVLAAVDTLPVPERSGEYGGEVWQRLQPTLPRRRKPWAGFIIRPPRWAMAGAVAALVLAAFLLGRYWQWPETPTTVKGIPGPAGSRVLAASVADHLERSSIVLIEIMHARNEKGRIDISANQSWAAELTAANRILRQTAQRNGEPGLASVLEDLERILLDFQHSPPRPAAGDLDGIRKRIEAQGLLFKVRILENQIRERQRAAARELARRSS